MLVLALLPACILAGCGSDSAATSPSTPAKVSAHSEANTEVETGPLKVNAKGSGSYRIRSHYTSVPSFGAEAGEAELRGAALTQHGYLVARVQKDWPTACSYVSRALVRTLASHSAKLSGKSCATILGAVTKPGPAGSEHELSEVEAESLRAKGGRAFLLYRAATAPYFMPMIDEGGVWKVAALDPTPFY